MMMQSLLSGIAIGSLYVLMSLGFTIQLGIANIVNAAHGAFMVAGMYVVYYCVSRLGWNPYAGVLLSTVVVGVGSLVVYKLVMESARKATGDRYQLLYSMLLLTALSVLFQLLFGGELRGLNEPVRSWRIGNGVITDPQIIAIVVANTVAFGFYCVFRFTTVGKILRICGKYEQGAKSIGVPVEAVFAGVFVLGSALAGLAGGLAMTYLPAQPYEGLDFVVIAFIVSIAARLDFLASIGVGLLYGVSQTVLNDVAGPGTAAVLTLSIFLVLLGAEHMIATARDVGRRGRFAQRLLRRSSDASGVAR